LRRLVVALAVAGSAAALSLAVGLGFVAYRVLDARLAAEVYRTRLEGAIEAYERLRARYDDLARRTAITELVVEDGRLSVSVRGATGELETIETALDPRREIFVDFVVLDGRLWIRRVFDEDTPPGQGVFVDPRLVQVDWSSRGARYGKAAYRPLDEGRWVVTVTGDGSLGLERSPDDAGPAPLELPPPLREAAPVEPELEHARAGISALDLLRALFAR
jgi:hypothetical protein